jgi:isopentenyldiphosphate isomerase
VSLPPAQDPDELFDVVTADGEPTGRAKRRADVHRDGDWHRALHIWVYGLSGEVPHVLMQRRGLAKDTNPGMLDPAVSGHLGAGESVEDGFREMEEEIGILPAPAKMRHVGTRPRAAEHTTPGIIDRELQDVYLYRDDRPLEAFRPNPAELEGLLRIRLDDALRLFAGEVTSVPAHILDAHTLDVRHGEANTSMFLATSIDRYYLRAVLAIDRELRSERYNVL